VGVIHFPDQVASITHWAHFLGRILKVYWVSGRIDLSSPTGIQGEPARGKIQRETFGLESVRGKPTKNYTKYLRLDPRHPPLPPYLGDGESKRKLTRMILRTDGEGKGQGSEMSSFSAFPA